LEIKIELRLEMVQDQGNIMILSLKQINLKEWDLEKKKEKLDILGQGQIYQAQGHILKVQHLANKLKERDRISSQDFSNITKILQDQECMILMRRLVL
jgi:hypothetical protein